MTEVYSILKFGLRLMLLFGLLIVPWPGWRPEFAQWFQAEARVVLRLVLPHEQIVVGPAEAAQTSVLDTQVMLTNPRRVTPEGQVVTTHMRLDSRSLGWLPNAMILSLLGATGRWRGGQWKVALACLIGTNVVVAITTAVCVLNGLSQATTPEGPGLFLMFANRLLVDNLWFSFVFPFLFWFICQGFYRRTE